MQHNSLDMLRRSIHINHATIERRTGQQPIIITRLAFME
jgi:hypothetical protein